MEAFGRRRKGLEGRRLKVNNSQKDGRVDAVGEEWTVGQNSIQYSVLRATNGAPEMFRGKRHTWSTDFSASSLLRRKIQ